MNRAIAIICLAALLQANLHGWQGLPANSTKEVGEQTPAPAPTPDSTAAPQPSAKNQAQPAITTIIVGAGPQGIAFTPGAVWVAWGDDDNFGVSRIDANTFEIVSTFRTD